MQGASAGPVSVVIPAHDEASTIGRLLGALTDHGRAGGEALDVVVVCNGCSDGTADIARRYQGVRVEEIAVASKAAALTAGDAVARHRRRAYVDADVVVSGRDLLAMSTALDASGALACGPRRRLDFSGVGWPVRAYYRVWEQLPAVRKGLFGRGVVMVGEKGFERLLSVPALLSDDLAMSEAFAPHERLVVPDAWVTIRPPKSTADLLRRRIRVVVGNAQAEDAGVRSAGARTTPGQLASMTRREPGLVGPVLVFLLVTVASRLAARRQLAHGDFTTWHRDESSRRP